MTMDVKEISIADFDYPLPDERIASHPLADRDACRLLVARPGMEPEDRVFRELPGLLPPGALLVCNDTRVINARMKFRRRRGRRLRFSFSSRSTPPTTNVRSRPPARLRGPRWWAT